MCKKRRHRLTSGASFCYQSAANSFHSLGCPGKEKNIARAGILTIESGVIEIKPVELVYDAERVVSEINWLDYPEAENIKKFFYGIK